MIEYKILEPLPTMESVQQLERALNELGAQGWDLVAVRRNAFILKKSGEGKKERDDA